MKNNIIPVSISLALFAAFSILTYFILLSLNTLNLITEKLSTTVVWEQVIIGMLIYFKTAVDYAIFVGLLMDQNVGTKKRIAMNVGTSIGAFIGVTMILVLWALFKEIDWLMFILLIIAGCILLSLGDASQEHFKKLRMELRIPLEMFFNLIRPVVSIFTFFMPEGDMKARKLGIKKLFILSAIVPFALGADDLAGYMSLLNAFNVFSILIGIYLADCIIDIALFANRELTIKIVKNQWVSYAGAIAFIILGVLSLVHAFKIYL